MRVAFILWLVSAMPPLDTESHVICYSAAINVLNNNSRAGVVVIMVVRLVKAAVGHVGLCKASE